MDDQRLPGDPQTIQRERNLESALLATLIEAHPKPLTEIELVHEMSSISSAGGRPADVRKALGELLGLGLVGRRGSAFEVTPVSLRISEFELGL